MNTRTRVAAELGHADDDFRVDLERIRFSPYYSRLSAVTQVIPQAGSGTLIHNRLTHSLKVTAVARSIAVDLIKRGANPGSPLPILNALGGCESVIVQAAASAHDLGHPPFGHSGEDVLDRLARGRLGLDDGFEGNAQTFRILTALDTSDAAARGLNLTAGVRAAVLKYPWTRIEWRSQPRHAPDALPRGVGPDAELGAQKFSAYVIDAPAMWAARAAYPAIAQHQQTIECAIMDVADDIAYSVHDLDDFYRSGILQHASVSAELRAWLDEQSDLAGLTWHELQRTFHRPGRSLELAWRSIRDKDAWIADEQAFRDAVERVSDDLGEQLLVLPFDGGIEAERAVAAFAARWIGRLRASIVVEQEPNIRSGHVRLKQEAWHDVVVLKFVHQRFVLDRPDLAVAQRGQERVLATLVDAFSAWLEDRDDAARVPRRLIDAVDAATESYFDLRRTAPELLPAGVDSSELRRLGRARAVIDYVASFTDAQAISVAGLLSGSSGALWEHGRSL